MKTLRILVALLTNDNDYQIEQANSAMQMAGKLGVEAKIVYADNDAINQSTQILKAIQAVPEERPDAVIFEPVGGTAFPQVARAAATAGVGWVVMNREADYIAELRQTCKAPVFALTSDHLETGRIHGRQFMAFLPSGGSVLYIQGPSDSAAAKERLLGMMEVKPANIHLTMLRGQWTEESAQRAVRSWLKLSTSQKSHVDLIGSQNDAMAIGVRKVFQELPNEAERDRWLSLPFTGCDGLPKTGQSWLRSGLLSATIYLPPLAGQAIELLVGAYQHGRIPRERVLVSPTSIPGIEALHPAKA
ncbi:MAG TPA: substrate-binding domain-containing protein [Candidatus Acidoferrum sp.]|nr:substrate-binding domain-containing protein [Candidatus Acidoferrum sp.]